MVETIKNSEAFGKPRQKKATGEKSANTVPAPKGAAKERNRVGRGPGSKVGKTAGRGSKGQKARNTVRRGFEGGQMPIHRRIPKRGFTIPEHKEYLVVNLRDIEKSGLTGDIDPKKLVESKILNKDSGLVKILGMGEISKSVNITADAFSDSAKEKIEKAGGSIKVRSKQA